MKKNIIKYICLTLAFVFCFLFTSTANVVHAVEQSDESWSTVVLDEVIVKSSTLSVNKTFYNVDAEVSSDGYFRFDFYNFMAEAGLSTFDYTCENFDWIFWENISSKLVYDNYADSADWYLENYGYIQIPVDASYSKYDMTLSLELEESSNNTTLIVKNNIDTQTTTIPAKYMTINGQVVTYISDDYFSLLYEDTNSFYNIFDIPGYMFSGQSDFIQQDGLTVDYYIKTGTTVADSITLIYEPFYFVVSNNITDEVIKVQPTLVTNDDGTYQYEYSFDLGSSVTLSDDQFDIFKDGVLNNCIIQDSLLLRSEYETLSASFNEFFGIDSEYIIDGFFGSQTGIRIDYNDRIFKKYDNRLDSFTFVLTSQDTFSNKIVLNFSNKDFVERELTEAERWNNFYDRVDSLGVDMTKIFSGILLLIVLSFILPFISPILSLLFAVAKFIIKVVLWVVTLPFKLIATLFKK